MTITQRSFILLTAALVFSGLAPHQAAAASSSGTATSDNLQRYPSPSGRYDLVFEPLPKETAHVQKARSGVVHEARELYAVTLYPAKSNQPLNRLFFADAGDPPSPEELLPTLLWSPQETYVVMPDLLKARIGNHAFQLVAEVKHHQAWRLEADHVRWIDDHRLVGELNTPEMPGGILEFDGTAEKAQLLVPPDGTLGYQLAAISGSRLMVKQFLNEEKSGKTTWAQFVPSCFELDLDTLTKRSTACP